MKNDLSYPYSTATMGLVHARARDRLTVAFFTAYPPSRGRLSEYAYEIVKSLRRAGVDVSVLSDSDPEGQGVMRAWSANRPLNPLKVFWRVSRLRPKILHFNLHFAVFGKGRLVNFMGFVGVLISSILARLMGIRCLITLHNLPDTIRLESYGVRRSFLNRVGFAIAKWLVKRSCPIAVTLRLYKGLLERQGFKEVYWVPHGSWLFPRGDPPPQGERVILFMGHISPGKDLSLLVRAFEGLPENSDGLSLALAGLPHPSFEEEGWRQLREVIGSPGVKYMGYVDGDDLERLLERTLCVVLPYRTPTGASGVLHMVSGAGVPVIAIDSPEFRELAIDGAGVLLVDADPDEISRAIESLMDDGIRLDLSKRSLKYADSRSWDKVAGIYVEVYRRLLSH